MPIPTSTDMAPVSPLTLFPDQNITLPLRYYGSVGYYAQLAAYGSAVLSADAKFDKREKEVHRCRVADVHGSIQLTLPIIKPHGIPHATWRDVRVSAHGQWWHVHRVTLESGYGRTPFFEYYIDRFLPFLSAETVERFPSVADLDMAIDAEIRKILLISTDVSVGTESPDSLRRNLQRIADIDAVLPPYYQVRADRLGFIAGLSALDLIFNLGPEAPLYLRSLILNHWT